MLLIGVLNTKSFHLYVIKVNITIIFGSQNTDNTQLGKKQTALETAVRHDAGFVVNFILFVLFLELSGKLVKNLHITSTKRPN